MLCFKKLRFLFLGLFVFLAGCSRYSSRSPIFNAFTTFGEAVFRLVSNEKVVLGFMFVAMLVGTFAMFKGLLKFSFKNTHGMEGVFGHKEINVIALMLSIIGTTGIFYVFKSQPSVMIHYFGGTIGLLFVLFICIMIMNYFLAFAKTFENPEGALGKGPGWIFIVILGSIFSSFLLLGYTGKVLQGLSCTFTSTYHVSRCVTSSGSYNLFVIIFNNIGSILSWLLFFAFVFGVWSLLNKKGEGADSSSSTPSSDGDGGGILGNMFGGKKKNKTPEDKQYDSDVSDMQENLKFLKKGMNEIVKSVNHQKSILEKVQKKLIKDMGKGGNN